MSDIISILTEMKETKKCEFKGCDNPALPLSSPPLCSVHIPDLDSWFISFREQLTSLDVPEDASETSRAILDFVHGLALEMGSELYNSALLQDPLCGELYKEFKNSIDPRDEVQFSFDEIVYFLIADAASGIVGNLAYDALKEIIRRISKRENDAKLIEQYEKTVFFTKCESLRIERHGSLPSSVEAKAEIEAEVKTKYHLIVRK
jgi:hypothetical protein